MATELELAQLIALNRVRGVGGQTIRNLISVFGSTDEIFKANINLLLKKDGIGKKLAEKLSFQLNLDIGKRELDFIRQKDLRIHSWYDPDFPRRLKNCADSPVLLFSKGSTNWNADRIVSIVGTRKATSYGSDCTEQLIAEMASKGNYIVVSGLAYGIDTIAHKACLRHHIPTWGVLAHGLDQIYPAKHRDIAKEMLKQGALITEFSSGTTMVPNNFLSRNRIVAGLSHCTIVVESAAKGGSLVTADIADSYNHDVFAFPGRATDKYSVGCNQLIRSNKAHLIQGLADLEYIMDWQNIPKNSPSSAQRQLFVELSPEEELLCSHLCKEPIFIDALCHEANIPTGKVLSLLFELELKGIVRSHVGRMYSLI
ncbi:MAG: DNA-processing protein DprA [Mangrovibacterium sp.]